MKVHWAVLPAAACILILGCTPESVMSTQSKYENVCTRALSEALEAYAKYDGWSVNEIRYFAVTHTTDDKMNSELKTNQFYNFSLIGNGVKVKNGFGATSNAVVECEGAVSKIGGEFNVPKSTIQIAVKLNGRRIDTLGQFEEMKSSQKK